MSEYLPQPDDDDLVNAPEAAAMLHTPVKTIYNWCYWRRKGKPQGPPFVKMGRRLLFRKGDVRRYVHDNTYGTDGDAA